jgi:peptide/nickel transport system substrate-binding protein
MAWPNDLGAFDPYHNRAIQPLFKLAYDSLVNLQPDGTFATGLAEKWTVSPRAATFTIRPNVTCSDGSPLTATGIAAAITYVSNPKNSSVLYNTWLPAIPMTAMADDATRTVKISLQKPFGFVLRTIGRLPIVCSKGLRDPKLLATGSDGSGPFILKKAVQGQSYEFTARDSYAWGPGGTASATAGMPKNVVIRIIENETTAANLLLSGELNHARVRGGDQKRLDAAGLGKVETPVPGAWLWLNHIGGRPTADKRVRQALVHALDVNEIVRVNTGGTGKASNGLINQEPKPCPGDTAAGELPEQDVAAAKRLLDQAGWTTSQDGVRAKGGKRLELDLHYIPTVSPHEQSTAELIAERWRAVGAQVKLTADTSDAYYQTFYKTSNYDVYLGGFLFDLPSQLMERLSGTVPPTGTNGAGIENREYNTLAAQAVTQQPPEACALWDKAERALYREVDIVPIAVTMTAFYFRRAQARFTATEWPIPTSIRLGE